MQPVLTPAEPMFHQMLSSRAKEHLTQTKISKWWFASAHLSRERSKEGTSFSQWCRCTQTTVRFQWWSTLGARLTTGNVHVMSKWTRIFQCGTPIASITFTIWTQLRSTYTTRRQNMPSALSWKATMRLSLPMGRQVRARLTQWKALSTMAVTHTEVSYLALWKKSSTGSSYKPIRIRHLWSEPVICRFITKLSPTCSRLSAPHCKSERIARKVFLWKGYLSGPSDLQMKSTHWCREVLWVALLPRQKWTICLHVRMPFSLSL